MFVVNDVVYDMRPYRDAISEQNTNFLPEDIYQYLLENIGKDMTKDTKFMAKWNKDKELRTCFNNLMIMGIVDYRKSARCVITNYVLLGFSVVLVMVIFVKFLAAYVFPFHKFSVSELHHSMLTSCIVPLGYSSALPLTQKGTKNLLFFKSLVIQKEKIL
jgi:hypothetical protein